MNLVPILAGSWDGFAPSLALCCSIIIAFLLFLTVYFIYYIIIRSLSKCHPFLKTTVISLILLKTIKFFFLYQLFMKAFYKALSFPYFWTIHSFYYLFYINKLFINNYYFKWNKEYLIFKKFYFWLNKFSNFTVIIFLLSTHRVFL